MSKQAGFLLHFSLGRFSARALCFFLCYVLLLLPLPSYALSPTEHLNNIERNLTAILAYSQKLETELENSQRISGEQKKSIEQLLSELRQLQTRLEVSRDEAKAALRELREYRAALAGSSGGGGERYPPTEE